MVVYCPTICGVAVGASIEGLANTALAAIQTMARTRNAVIIRDVAGFSSCFTVSERAIFRYLQRGFVAGSRWIQASAGKQCLFREQVLCQLCHR